MPKLWHRLQLWLRSDAWPVNYICLRAAKKVKTKIFKKNKDKTKREREREKRNLLGTVSKDQSPFRGTITLAWTQPMQHRTPVHVHILHIFYTHRGRACVHTTRELATQG